tara:strand:- start:569 stop:973 length:405 start_codon:yes stop_codon:yes gene_type:complete
MISLFYAGALGLFAIILALLTVRQRFKTEISLGTGDSEELLAAQRAHGNFIEYSLIFLVLSFALEIIGEVPDLAIIIFGDIFLLARISHAYTLLGGGNIIFRQMGIMFSWLVILTQSFWAMIISGPMLISNLFG